VAAAVGGFPFGFDTAVVNWGVDAIQVAFHLSSFLTEFAVALTGEAPVPTASVLAGDVGHGSATPQDRDRWPQNGG
jgi:hypothetical protein